MFCISQNTVWSQEGGTQNNSGFSSQKKNQNWKYRMQVENVCCYKNIKLCFNKYKMSKQNSSSQNTLTIYTKFKETVFSSPC